MKKIVTLLLVLALTLGLTCAVSAADVGSITINGVTSVNTYEIYKLLDLESYNKADGAYAYKVNSAWATYFTTAEALSYFSIDSDGYVTWTAGEDDATVAEFAQKALAYAKANGIAPVKSSQNAGDMTITGTTGVFADLSLGYYLVDSNAGALCGLTTTDPDASINAKNGVPTIDKQVQEDLSGLWGDYNTAASYFAKAGNADNTAPEIKINLGYLDLMQGNTAAAESNITTGAKAKAGELVGNVKAKFAKKAECCECECDCDCCDCDNCDLCYTEEEYEKARSEGYDEGYADGHSDGYDEGAEESLDEDEVIEAVRQALRQ